MVNIPNNAMTNRHRFRADWHDYNHGVYFVTICSRDKRSIFGNICSDNMILNDIGDYVKQCIEAIPSHHDDTEVWNYVVMPNHIHMIIFLRSQINIAINQSKLGCLKPPKHDLECEDFHHNSRLAKVIGTFKASVSRKTGIKCWQSRFHEHIIKDQQSYNNIMDYIDNNVINWQQDCFYRK